MRLVLFLCLCLPSLILAQKTTEKERPIKLTIEPVEGAVPYTNLNFNNDEDQFQFAIVTDRTGGHRPGVFMDGVHKLNLMQPEFVMSVGDLIEGYTKDTAELIRQWNEFDHFVGQLEMPFFYVPGNHDITNQVMEDLWRDRLGQTYYHFVYKDVLFLALNSEDKKRGAGRGTISDKQYQFIEGTLDKYKDVKWTLVFLHQPLWHQKQTNRWNEVEELLADRPHTVFAGHEHRYVKEDRNEGKYFTLATTGGGSSLRGTKFGEFDHMVWVTMTEKGPIIANLLLEGIMDENIVTKARQDWLDEISREKPFQITPVILNDEPFRKGSGTIKITNDRNVPMQVAFEEINSGDLIGLLDKKFVELGPNSVEVVNYQLESRNDNQKHPFKLKAMVSYISEDELMEVALPYIFNLKPIEKRMLSKVTNEITIDGDESDWGILANSLPEGEEFKAAFDLRYDDQYLYMAMRVEDSLVYVTGDAYAWRQDNIGIGFSAEPFVKSGMNTGRNYYSDILFMMITPEIEGIPSVISADIPVGTKYKCVLKPYGYFGEVAVPLDYIKEQQGDPWRTIRVAAAVDDFDGDSHKKIWWLANWRDADSNYIGSGMYWKNR